MLYEDFQPGIDFWCARTRYRCVDIARHHILAVRVRDGFENDPEWPGKPPYYYGIIVFDAHDWPVCFKSYEAWKAAYDD